MNEKQTLRYLRRWFMGDVSDASLRSYVRNLLKAADMMPPMMKFLEDTAYNDEGDEIAILTEDNEYVYYNDGCDRYCYMPKSEEGTAWKRV
jgi:hypothetical protein